MLDFQQIPIPFASGVDTLSDKFQIPVGKLAALENGVFSRNGSISLRNGFTALPKTLLTGGNISAAKAIGTFGDEIVLLDGSGLYSYSETLAKWVYKGPCPICNASIIDVGMHAVSYLIQPGQPDIAYHAGMIVMVWRTSGSGSLRYSIIDAVSGAAIVMDSLFFHADAVLGTLARVVWFDGAFRIFWLVGSGANEGTLMSSSIDPASPLDAPTHRVEMTGCEAGTDYTEAFDTGLTTSGQLVVVIGTVAAGPAWSWTAVKYGVGFTVTDTYTYAANPTLKYVSLSLATSSSFLPGWDGVWVMAVEDTYYPAAHVHWWAKKAGSADIHSNGVIYSPVTALPGHIVGVENGLGSLRVIYESEVSSIATPSSKHHNLYYCDADVGIGPGYAMSMTALATFKRGMSLAGKPFRYGGNSHFPVSTLWLGYPGDTVGYSSADPQSTYYLLDYSGFIEAKTADGEATHYWRPTIPSTITTETGVWLTASLHVKELDTGWLAPRNVPGVSMTRWDFTSTNVDMKVQGKELLIAGGILHSYDGSECVEHGFLEWPGKCNAVSATTGGTIQADTYSYKIIYRWRDAFGQYHQSASQSVSATTTTATSTVTLTIPTLRLTEKILTSVDIVIYRDRGATSGDSTYYKLDSTSNVDADTVTVVDAGSHDANLANNEVLYSTGGVLENTAPPSGKLIAVAKSRVFISDGEVVYFSKVVEEGKPVEFTDTNYVRIEPRGGAISAMEIMDSNLIIWKDGTGAYQLYGDGPDNTGGGSAYSEPILVSTDVGCSAPKSIGLTPDGLVFQSGNGIHRLSRSLQTEYIGAPVDGYNSQTMTNCTVLPAKNEVRFLCSDGNALVLNSLFNQWGVFTIEGVDACVWKGSYTYVTSAGVVEVENTSYDDDGVAVQLLVETPWYSFAGLNNYQKARKFLLLGSWQGAHNLTVDTQSDLVPTWGTPVTIPQTTVVTVDSPVQATVHLAHQKTQAVKVRIKAVSTGTGDTVRLSGLTFTVGLKRGPFRMASTKHFGA